MVSAKITDACEIRIRGEILIESREKYSKTKIKETMRSKTGDLLSMLKKFLAKYIVIKTAKMAMVSKPKVKPEKKSKNTATIIMIGKSASISPVLNKANKMTKTGKIKTG